MGDKFFVKSTNFKTFKFAIIRDVSIVDFELHLPNTLSNAKIVYILNVDFDEWNNIGIHDFSIRDHLGFRNRCVAMNSFKIQN